VTAALAGGSFDGASALVLETSVPAVATAPAPWKLTGSGYVFMIRLPRTMTDDDLFTPPQLRGKRVGNVATLMIVDYATSGVGPYREVLVTPGIFQGEHGRFHSVTRIYVSTYESVANGRVNWGIPKDVADFSIDDGENGAADILVSRAGRPLARLRVEAGAFRSQSGADCCPPRAARWCSLGAARRTGRHHLHAVWSGALVSSILVSTPSSFRISRVAKSLPASISRGSR
jgi:hypothetical protein